jgi:MT0933-like antitoxin protein
VQDVSQEISTPTGLEKEAFAMDIGNLAGKAGDLVNEHGATIEDAAEKVGDFVKDKFGHAEQVDMVVDKVKDLIPDGPQPADGA